MVPTNNPMMTRVEGVKVTATDERSAPTVQEPSREWDDLNELEDVSFEDTNVKPVPNTNLDARQQNLTKTETAHTDDGAPTRQMHAMFTRAGMSLRSVEMAVERLFTFDE